MELHKKLFGPSNRSHRINTPLKLASACPEDSAYINEDFGKMDSSKYIAVNVGCNKGLDAVAMAALLSQDRKFSTDSWRKSLGPIFGASCGEPQVEFYDGIPAREGRVFCIEPVPNTFGVLEHCLETHPDYRDSLVITQAAMSNTSGKVLFPDAKAGEEARSLGDCYAESKPKDIDSCVEVPLYTVDSYLAEQNVDLSSTGDMIDLMRIDSEGFDWEVIQGSLKALERTKYVTFEVHVNGNWMKHSLVDTIETTFKDFNCYWVGIDRLWRITDCMDDERLKEIYEFKSWSTVGCVRRTEVELAQRMEQIFLHTQYMYNQTAVTPITTPQN